MLGIKKGSASVKRVNSERKQRRALFCLFKKVIVSEVPCGEGFADRAGRGSTKFQSPSSKCGARSGDVGKAKMTKGRVRMELYGPGREEAMTRWKE